MLSLDIEMLSLHSMLFVESDVDSVDPLGILLFSSDVVLFALVVAALAAAVDVLLPDEVLVDDVLDVHLEV